MDDKQFDKRMELLKKSYDRMESQLDPADVFTQIEAEKAELPTQPELELQKLPSKWQKPTVWAASIASVLLIGMLTAPYMLKKSEPVQSEVSPELNSTTVEYDEWLENMTKKYESQREQVRKELLVSSKELASFSFIKNADSMMDFYKTRNHGYEDALQLASTEENILNYLMTPRRAIEYIQTYDRLGFNESYHIYSLYNQSIEELKTFYSNLLQPYAQLLVESTDASQFPSDLQAIIKAANRQFLELQIDGGEVYFKANPIDGEFALDYINKLHPDVFGYFEYSRVGYLLLVNDLRYSREATLQSLKIMERTLLADQNTGSSDYSLLKATFENTWLALLKGTVSYPAKTKANQFDEQYVHFLQETADGEYGEVMEETASTILKEIQQSNYSATLEHLSVDGIWGTLFQIREESMMGDQFDSNFSTVGLNESQKEQILAIYTQYTKSYDETLINQLHPMNIAGLYLYASAKEDKRVMDSLTIKDIEIETSTLQQIKSLDVFSEMGVSNGFQPIVAVRLVEEYQAMYGRQFFIKLSPNEEGNYRIIEIKN